MLPVRFNFQNVMQPAVGDHGLRPTDLDIDAAASALQAFRVRVDTGEATFPNLPLDSNAIKSLEEFAAGWSGQLEHILFVAPGGAALCARALDVALRGPHAVQRHSSKSPALVVLDRADPELLSAALENANPKKTLLCLVLDGSPVTSASGSEQQAVVVFRVVYDWLTRAMSSRKAAQRVAIVGPEAGDFAALARQEKFTLFPQPAGAAGALGLFSPVGMLPASLIGADVGALARGARDANTASWSRKIDENLAMQSALVHHALVERGKRVKLIHFGPASLSSAAAWYGSLSVSTDRTRSAWESVAASAHQLVVPLDAAEWQSQSARHLSAAENMVTFWVVDRARADFKVPALKPLSKAAPEVVAAGTQDEALPPGTPLSAHFAAARSAAEAAATIAGRPNCRWHLPRLDEYHLGMFLELLAFQAAFTAELSAGSSSDSAIAHSQAGEEAQETKGPSNQLETPILSS